MNKFLFLVLVALIWGNYSFAQDADDDVSEAARAAADKPLDYDSGFKGGVSEAAENFGSGVSESEKDLQEIPKTSGFDSGFSGGVSGAVNDAIEKANENLAKDRAAEAE